MSEIRKTCMTVVLDRSGSMYHRVNDVIEGYNTYIAELDPEDNEVFVNLLLFDTKFDYLYQDMPLDKVPPLNHETFVPRGNTCLYDAIGRAVSDAKAKTDNTTRHILVVITDGLENSSKEFKQADVKKLMDELEESDNWTVVFLAESMDAWAQSRGMGIKTANTVKYNDANVKGMFAATAGGMNKILRSGGLAEKNFATSNKMEYNSVGSSIGTDLDEHTKDQQTRFTETGKYRIQDQLSSAEDKTVDGGEK